jgi:small subunit ribosomal protein S1
LALGHKQLEENPWDAFEDVFAHGSSHKCTILSKNDKGAVLELPYGIEGFCLNKNLIKEDAEKAEVGETLDFKVIDFSKDDKRILLSHLHTHKDDAKVPAPAAKKSSSKKSNTPSNSSSNDEGGKATLGDLDVLSQLKEDMKKG